MTLPHSIEAERRLLGCCLLPDSTTKPRAIKAGCSSQWFYDSKHQIIWEAIAATDEPDELSVSQQLNGTLEAIGGIGYLYSLSGDVATTARDAEAIQILGQHAIKRKLLSLTKWTEEQISGNAPADELLAHVQQAFNAVSPATKDAAPRQSITDILGHTSDPNQYLLSAGYLGRSQITTLIGPGGVGKSRIALMLAYCHASGCTQFFGLPLRGHPARWLFIGSENDTDRIKTDLTNFTQSFTPEQQAEASNHIEWYNPDNDPDSSGGFIDTPESFRRLCQVVKDFRPDVIVLDTLASVCLTLELNSDADMRTACAQVKLLMAHGSPGCRALIIHHAKPGKDQAAATFDAFSSGSFGRNSKVLANMARAEILVTVSDSENPERLALQSGKLNNGKKFDPIGIIYHQGTYIADQDFDAGTFKDDVNGQRSGNSCSQKDIILAIRSNNLTRQAIQSAVRDATGASPSTIDRRIRQAKSAGFITSSVLGSFLLTDKAKAVR